MNNNNQIERPEAYDGPCEAECACFPCNAFDPERAACACECHRMFKAAVREVKP